MNIINGILESNRIRNRRAKNVKFTEGYWLRSERGNGLFATEGYYVDEIPGGMRIVAATAHTNDRGGTLNMPTITIEFVARNDRTIAVSAWHYEGYDAHLPQFEKTEEIGEAKVTITEDEALMDTGVVQVRVNRKQFSYAFEADGKVLTSSNLRNLGLIRWDRQPSTMFGESNYLTEKYQPYMM